MLCQQKQRKFVASTKQNKIKKQKNLLKQNLKLQVSDYLLFNL